MINNLKKYTDFKTRLKFANAHILGKLNYILPLLTSTNKTQLNKVHKLLMFAAWSVIGSYCFKVSIKNILSQVGWLSANQLIKWSGLKLIHKILYFKKPSCLFNKYKVNRRKCAQIIPKLLPKSKFSKDIYIFKSLDEYNRLPTDLKTAKPKQFKYKGIKYPG